MRACIEFSPHRCSVAVEVVNPSKSHLSVWIMTVGCKQISSKSVSEPSSIILSLHSQTHPPSHTWEGKLLHARGGKSKILTYIQKPNWIQVLCTLLDISSKQFATLCLQSCSTSLKCWKHNNAPCTYKASSPFCAKQPHKEGAPNTPTTAVKCECKYGLRTRCDEKLNRSLWCKSKYI